MSKIEILEFFPTTAQAKWNIEIILGFYSEDEEEFIALEDNEVDEELGQRLLKDINGIISGTGQIPQADDVIIDQEAGDIYCVHERYFDCRANTVTLSLF